MGYRVTERSREAGVGVPAVVVQREHWRRQPTIGKACRLLVSVMAQCRCVSKKVSMRAQASTAEAGSGPMPATRNKGRSGRGPFSASLRNACPAAGYSFTSWTTPAAVSAASSFAAAPLSVRSLPPFLPTIGQAPPSAVRVGQGQRHKPVGHHGLPRHPSQHISQMPAPPLPVSTSRPTSAPDRSPRGHRDTTPTSR